MNIIISIAVKLLQSVKNLYEDAKANPYFKRYAVSALLLALLFTVILFPVDSVILKIIREAEGKSFQSAEVSNLKASLFGDISFDSIKINLRSREEITINKFVSTIPVFSLIRGQADGEIESDQISFSSPKFKITSKIKLIADTEFSTKNGIFSNGSLLLKLTNSTLEGLSISGVTFKPANIESVNGEILFQDKKYNIKLIKIDGKSLRGTIKGNVIPNENNFSLSTLDLVCSFDPESEMFEDKRMIINYLIDKDSGKIVINLKGTIANPEVIMPKMSMPQMEMKNDK